MLHLKLPYDCVHEICLQLDSDIQSLYSCMLIDRNWCRAAIRFLWKHPFGNETHVAPEKSLRNVLDIYLCFLTNEQKLRLDRHLSHSIFTSDQFNQVLLFPYPQFLKAISTSGVIRSVQIWLGHRKLRSGYWEINVQTLWEELAQILISQPHCIHEFSSNHLFYIKHHPFNLFKFNLENDFNSSLRTLRKLYFHGKYPKSELLRHVGDVSTQLELLYVEFLSSQDDCESLGFLIRKQNKLQRFLLSDVANDYGVYHFLRGLDLSITNTLNNTISEVAFQNVNFKNSSLLSLLNYFPYIKSFAVIFCRNLNLKSDFSDPHDLQICKRLRILKIIHTLVNTRDMNILLKQAGEELLEFKLHGWTTRRIPTILQSVTMYSPNLRTLAFPLHSNFCGVNKMLRGRTQLQRLTLCRDVYRTTALYSAVNVDSYLISFGASLPKGIKRIDVDCYWKFRQSTLKKFFEVSPKSLECLTFGNSVEMRREGINVLLDIENKSQVI